MHHNVPLLHKPVFMPKEPKNQRFFFKNLKSLHKKSNILDYTPLYHALSRN